MREYPLAVGAGHDVVRRNRLLGEVQSLSFHDQVGAPVRSVIAQRHQALRRVNVDAVPLIREMRSACSARGQNQVGLSSLRGNPNEVGVLRLSAVEGAVRSEEHTSELQSRETLVCRLLLEKKQLST